VVEWSTDECADGGSNLLNRYALEGGEDLILGDIKAKFTLVKESPLSSPEKDSPGEFLKPVFVNQILNRVVILVNLGRLLSPSLTFILFSFW